MGHIVLLIMGEEV